MADVQPIIHRMEIVANSKIREPGQEIEKEEKMEIESDKVEKLCTELEAIIYGQIRGNSICGMISKRRTHSRSIGDSSSGSSNSNSAIHNRSCSKRESSNTGIIIYKTKIC